MIKYGYYGLLSAFSILLVVSIIYYLVKPAPTGDSSVGWATGLFYLAGLAGFVLLALLFWRHKTVGLVILAIPLLLSVLPAISGKLTDLYAWLPSKSRQPLTLHIVNNTRALVNVKLECWFGDTDDVEHSLYKTLEFTSKPLGASQHLLSEYDAGLLSTKSGFVRVVLFECVEQSGNGYSTVREIQPCMQNEKVAITAFQTNNYIISIDSEKNTQQFKDEVRRLKQDSLYTNGVF